MLRGKNSLISLALTYFFKSTACGAAIPCQITSTMYTSTSALFDPQYCRYSWSVEVASAGLLMYSRVLLVFLAHSYATALVQRPLSPTRSESPANRTVSPEAKWRGVNRETRKRTPRNRMAFRPKELFRRFIWGKPFHGCNKPLEVISCKLFFCFAPSRLKPDGAKLARRSRCSRSY